MNKYGVQFPTLNIKAGSIFGGEKGIRTPGTVITVHMISNHAPSASSDISPYTDSYYIKSKRKNQGVFENFIKTNDILLDFFRYFCYIYINMYK